MDTAQQEIASLERIVGPQGASPLFARLADLYLAAGRPKDALRVCDAGLAHFPFYTTGHFVKGRTLIALDMTNEARRELEFVRDWLPTNPTIWSYLDSLPISEDQTLESVAGTEAPVPAVVEEPAFAPTPSVAAEQQATPGGFFSAITEEAPPTAAADTVSSVASPAEENVFGLPSEAPVGGFGGFGGGDTAEQSPQSFGGFGGFGGVTESATLAVEEPETTSPSPVGFSGFGETAGEVPETTDAGFHTQEEPLASYEETVSGALGVGAPGFVPTSGIEASESSFEAYADRQRLDLGPTGLISLEQFLEGEGIVPAGSSDGSSGFNTESITQDSVFESPAAEEPAREEFNYGGTTTPEVSSEPEAPASFGGLDFSGLPTADEPAAPSPAPAVEEGSFSGPAFDGPPAFEPPSGTSIEGLTEKLKSAKKITPVIDFSSKASSDSDDNAMASSGFVTPTLAEIYAKQGWYDDAIKAYRNLAKTKPADREKYEARIAELEEEKKKQT